MAANYRPLSIDTRPYRVQTNTVGLTNRDDLSPYQNRELQRYIDANKHLIGYKDLNRSSPKSTSSPASRKVYWKDDLRARSASPGRYGRETPKPKTQKKMESPTVVNMYEKSGSTGSGDGLFVRSMKWQRGQRVYTPHDPVPHIRGGSEPPFPNYLYFVEGEVGHKPSRPKGLDVSGTVTRGGPKSPSNDPYGSTSSLAGPGGGRGPGGKYGSGMGPGGRGYSPDTGYGSGSAPATPLYGTGNRGPSRGAKGSDRGVGPGGRGDTEPDDGYGSGSNKASPDGGYGASPVNLKGYGTGPTSPYGTGAGPGYGTGAGPGYGTGAGPGYGTGAGPGYGTGAGPGYGTGAGPGHGYGPGDGTGSDPNYGTNGYGPGAGSPGSGYGGPTNLGPSKFSSAGRRGYGSGMSPSSDYGSGRSSRGWNIGPYFYRKELYENDLNDKRTEPDGDESFILNPHDMIRQMASQEVINKTKIETTYGRERKIGPQNAQEDKPSRPFEGSYSPFPPYKCETEFNPWKFVKQVRDDGLTESQKAANLNQEPGKKPAPLPASMRQLKHLAKQKSDAPGARHVDFLTGCMLHNLKDGRSSVPEEVWN